MARGSRRWGQLCPIDGGLLLEHSSWGERLWCPSNGHGGNGRFFAPSQTAEGYEIVPTGDGSGLSVAQQEALAKAAAEKAGLQPKPTTAKADKAAKAATPKAEAAKTTAKEPRSCECECGGTTKGGRFLPGHDAILHSRQKKAAAEAAAAK